MCVRRVCSPLQQILREQNTVLFTGLFSVREKLNDCEEICEILQEVNVSNFWDSSASFILPAAKMFVYFLLKE